jgi:hypothetical protein
MGVLFLRNLNSDCQNGYHQENKNQQMLARCRKKDFNTLLVALMKITIEVS